MAKEQRKENLPKTCVLKVMMHCQCNGCIKKINDGVKEIALSEGGERADLVAETAEVIVVGRMNLEKLCCLSHELTQKHVKIPCLKEKLQLLGKPRTESTRYHHLQPNMSVFHLR